MRTIFGYWVLCFLACVATASGLKAMLFDSPRFSPASALELTRLGGASPFGIQVTNQYSQAACNTGSPNCSNCGGHCCVCEAMGTAPLYGQGSYYMSSTQASCNGFVVYPFCTGGVCSGSPTLNSGACGPTYLTYYDP